MNGLKAILYYYSLRNFRGAIRECSGGKEIVANYTSRWMSHNTLQLESNLTEAKEISEETVGERFGEVALKKKPLLATSLADFADRSPVLQKLIDLGVNIHRFDQDWNLCKYIMRLDFEKDIKPHLMFLHEHGVEYDGVGPFLTNNPYILQCDLDDLEIRINYLQSKKFSKEMIAQILNGNARWLSFKVKIIDKKLGDLQKSFNFSGNHIRHIVVTYPRIVNVDDEKLKLNVFMLKEQLLISYKDAKKIVTKEPVLLGRDPNHIMKTFYYLQDKMSIPVHLVIEQPDILMCKDYILATRHNFLVKLGRAQYDPKQPGYVSLQNIGTLDDENFCQTVAKTTLDVYHDFQKTL